MFSFFTIITSVQYGAILLDHRVGTFIGRIRIRVVTWTLFRCRLTIVVALFDVVFFIVVVSILNCDDREINRLIMIIVRHCCTVQYWMQRQDVECISYTETIPTLLHNESKQQLLYSCRLYVASNFNCRIKLGGLLKIARNHVQCRCGHMSKSARRYYYGPLIGITKWYMAYWLAAISMTLSDLQGHLRFT